MSCFLKEATVKIVQVISHFIHFLPALAGLGFISIGMYKKNHQKNGEDQCKPK
ncbi:hypothetical protein CFter6_0712 [Collimonas fungivorans]|uniref:Transmembrane protein n=1 Tax=Collimonas fungivorans TaxID=158899 RepID=A0A127P6N2_9BURK|nr:hypothetical protein CFter6_0712 [Collimonas fungivorans]